MESQAVTCSSVLKKAGDYSWPAPTYSWPVTPVLGFSCGRQFSLIFLNFVNQIMTYQVNRLYLVVQYTLKATFQGQCRVKAELLHSTSIIAWSTGSRNPLCAVSDVPVKYQVYVTAFQVILGGPNEVEYVVINDANCGTMHSPQHGTSIDDDSIRYSLDLTCLSDLEFRLQNCLRLGTHISTLSK